MENKERLKRVAHGFNIAIKVIRIIILVCAIICFIGSIIFFACGGTGVLVKIYESNPEALKNIEINLNNNILGLFYVNQTTMGDLYEAGELNSLMYALGGITIVSAIEGVILYVVLIFFRNLFVRLETTETPFTKEATKDLKVAFILITVLVSLNDFILGIIVAGLLACMYVMFLYGCKLQENEDSTL